MLVLIAATLLVASPAQSPTDELSVYIQALEPRLGVRRTATLAEAILRMTKRYDLDPQVFAAIIMQESGFRPGLKACWEVARNQRCETTCDYGLAQVNELWIKKWGLDPVKLQFDEAYNIGVAARILKGLAREHDDEPNWYGRYHSGTPSKRSAYEGKLADLLARR